MAVRFDSGTDRLVRTANLPPTTGFTICGWFRRVSHSGIYASFMGFGDVSSSPNRSYEFAWGSDGVLEINTYPSGAATDFATTYGNGEWFFAAMSGSSSTSTLKVYAGDFSKVPLEEVTATWTANVFAAVWIGDNGYGESGDFRAAAIKIWDAQLTAAELENERFSLLPKRLSNLNVWSPLFYGATERVLDYSGNGRNFTTGGTLADEEAPPISWHSGQHKRIFFFSAPPVTATSAGEYIDAGWIV